MQQYDFSIKYLIIIVTYLVKWLRELWDNQSGFGNKLGRNNKQAKAFSHLDPLHYIKSTANHDQVRTHEYFNDGNPSIFGGFAAQRTSNADL